MSKIKSNTSFILDDSKNPLRIEFTETPSKTRLDRLLANILPAYYAGLSRNHVQAMIKDGAITCNSGSTRPSYSPVMGDCIQVDMSYMDEHFKESASIDPVEMDLDIVFEDDHIIVINKTNNLVVHPAPSVREPTLVNGLHAHWGELPAAGSPERPGIVHRLDKNTSGLIVIARTQKTYLALVDMFRDRKIDKRYIAVTSGMFLKSHGEMHTDFGRNPSHRKKMTGKIRSGRKAHTEWELLHSALECSIVSVRIHTGRTHQIRVHMAESGHPIIGDPLYGNREGNIRKLDPELKDLAEKLPGQALHAASLSFEHPETGRLLEFHKDPPEPMKSMIRVMGYDSGME